MFPGLSYIMRAQYVLPYDPLLAPSKFNDRYEPLRTVTSVTSDALPPLEVAEKAGGPETPR